MLDDVVDLTARASSGARRSSTATRAATTGPSCFSVLLGGGGLKGGQVIGASEPRGGKVPERPVSPADLLATLYQALGIPLDTHYEDASGRPVSIVGPGKPIQELL